MTLPRPAYTRLPDVAKALTPTLLTLDDHDPRKAAAALITRALALGIHPGSVANWLAHTRRQVHPDLRDLARSSGYWRGIARSVQGFMAETYDPKLAATKAVGWLLAEATIDGSRHRRAVAMLMHLARETVRSSRTFGDAIFQSAADLALDLGITKSRAQEHLLWLGEIGCLDLRSFGAGKTRKLRVKNAPRLAWERTQQPDAQALIQAIMAGEGQALGLAASSRSQRASAPTVFDAVSHPGIAYGETLAHADPFLVLLQSLNLDPRTHGYSASTLVRARRRLREQGVTDAESLLAAADLIADQPTSDGRTPRELRAAAEAARTEARESRTAEIQELQLAGRAAWREDPHDAHGSARHARDAVRAVLSVVGAPGGRRGDELRAHVGRIREALAPQLHTPAERAAARAILAAHVSDGRTPGQVARLTADMTEAA